MQTTIQRCAAVCRGSSQLCRGAGADRSEQFTGSVEYDSGKRGATLYEEATVENVLPERRKELALEGHRFFDLVRNEKDILKVEFPPDIQRR